MSKPKPPGDETIKNHPAFPQGVTDSYVGRMKVSVSELNKVAEAAPEVSQGPWRERAYQARSVMDRQELNQTLLAALRTSLSNANLPRVAFDALKPVWLPALRQAIEQAGGDGIDVWLYGLFAPPVRVPKQTLFADIAEALIRMRNARDLGKFEEEALKIVERIDTAVADPARAKISFKQMEKELEGKLEVDEVLGVRGSTDDELSRRLHEFGGSMTKLRDEIRGSGKQPSGIFANFVRLKYELKILDLEMKRRSGTLQARSAF
ncbi:MAG: hypothetical protein ACO1OB_16620 [Archangium sp.]